MILDKTLKEWEDGGSGTGGVDIVSLQSPWSLVRLNSFLGLCHHRVWHGY